MSDPRVTIRVDVDIRSMPIVRPKLAPCCWRMWSRWLAEHGIAPATVDIGVVFRDVENRRLRYVSHSGRVATEVQLESLPLLFPTCRAPAHLNEEPTDE